MYNNLTKTRRGRPWLLLAALFAWLLPQTAAADENFVDEPSNYTVSLGGSNVIYISAPVYDMEGADTWVEDGNLKASWEGQDEITVLHWESQDTSNSSKTVDCKFSTNVKGYFDITPGNTTSTTRLTNDGTRTLSLKQNGDGYTFEFGAEWVVPYNVLGKKVKFTWSVKRYGTGRYHETVNIKEVTITIPQASAKLEPFVSMPMLSTSYPGKLEVPWFLASDSIVSARYEYDDVQGKHQRVDIKDMNKGIIMLDAHVPHRNFHVVCSYKQPGDKGSYLIDEQSSTTQNIPLIHTPIGLSARPLNDQKVKAELTWSVPYMDNEDLTTTDFFEIQRSLTGLEQDFVTVHQEPYISTSNKPSYTFIDSTLVDDITERMLTNGGTLDKLTYRIRRVMTQDWNWAKTPCVTSTRCVLDNLHLLRIADYSARWEDQKAYTVRVNWDYVKEPGAVWDDRAQMVLRVVSHNSAGAVVDSLIYELDQNARAQRTMVVSLSRSCVYYDIDMYVERGESPLKLYDGVEPYFFPIRTYDDWQEFNRMGEAANGQYDLNARLYADITVNTILGWKSGSPYRGTFDGNGHTLTINYDGSANSAYNGGDIAPFRYVTNATIKNLHVAGTISTSGRTAAGLIASVRPNATVAIENCRVSANINSTVNGDATNGGFVSIANTGASVLFRNCKFDGSFEGANCSHNGGFVGYTNAPVNIDNCVFAPDHITTKLDGCNTWARLGSGSCTLVNSYATHEYSACIVIRNASDWTTFKNMVEASKNQYDVDARLEADISLNSAKDIAGYSGNYPYRGTFDGNGHTITLNISDNARRTALFSHVANATFKNLHLAGTVSSSQPSMGSLIGIIDEGYTVTIENCHSSVTLKNDAGNDACVGGFVGFIDDSSTNKLTFRNCKFDGSFEGNSSSNGGFVGWANGSVIIENCLFAPDHISTKFDNCETWARHNNNATVTITNSHATKEYGTVEIVTIDGKPFMVLRSNADWLRFKAQVEKDANTNAILDGDFTTTDTGSWTNYFSGIFDGNGHTITANIEGGSTENVALFRIVRDCTIKNLHVKGTIKGGYLTAGLIGNATVSSSSARNKVSNCRVSANIVSTSWFAGGIIGRGNYTDVANCRFDGSIECQQTTAGLLQWWAGVIYGLVESGEVTAGVQNCLDQGQFKGNFDHRGMNYKQWTEWGNGENQWCHDNYTYNDLTGSKGATSTAGLSLSQLVDKLGNSNWEIVGGIAVPKMFKTDIPANPLLTMSASDMVALLGSDWMVVDGKAVPVMRTTTVDTSEDSFSGKLGSGWTQEDGALVPATTTVADPQSAPETIAISTHEDWVKFRDMVEAAKGQKDVNAVLKANIDANNIMVGWTEGTAYRGTFDGNGHTISLNASNDGSHMALFRYAKDYTIKNLHVTGSVKGGQHSAGLVGNSTATSGKRNVIENCRVSVEVDCSSTHAGGIIGHGFRSDHTITNCLFDGSIKCSGNNTQAGVFMGWDDSHTGNIISNCLENGSYEVSIIGLNNSYAGGVYGNGGSNTNNWSYHDWDKANKVGTLSVNELAAKLGSANWQVVGDKVVPVFKGALPNFYHKNTGTIDPVLLTQTRQSSVLLTWNTDGNPIDFFQVLRRVKGQGDDQWQEVATDLTDLSYEDTSVSPLATYEYKVLGVNDCEGISTTETQVKVGECKHTGRVDGYVRFNDGTSAAGIEVEISYNGTKVTSVFTDDSGHYVADELSYYGKTSVEYEVSAVSKNGVEFMPKIASVTFDATSNDETLREISILNGKRFSGYVMYDGTSIPVKGANFKVNGQKVYNTRGKLLETEYDGSFSFRVLPGNDTIQVVMDGHTFTNGGYYKSDKGHNFTDDVANTYFYDATKVKLTGRVVGGDIQGKKPLMNNLSTNNLGDSLTMVLTLEGDNTSWLVYDNLNPNRTVREEVVRHQRKGDKHYTTVKTERKRMTVWPDAKTGEYELLLPPVRWKVQQVYCTGYPTLFQEGQVSEVVDLTDCLVLKDTTVVGSFKDADTTTVVDPKATYHAVYNRIYHAPVEVTYRQLGYDTFNYFGDKNYQATQLTGESVEVPLAFKNPADTTQAKYAFGYPVFSVERKYTIELQVGENYPYNNDPAGLVDIVRMGGGYASMQNGMNPGAPAGKPVEVDSLGRARFTLQAAQTPVLLTGESALKTVTFTVLRDGTYLEAKPLQGYVLNMFPVGDSKDILTDGQPVLFDILRDPPGAYSTNTLAKGTTLNYSYVMNLSLTAGVSFWYKWGKDLKFLNATVAAPAGTGTANGPISEGKIEEGTVNELMYNAQGSKAFSYTMVVGNNISTSGDPSMVGADADLYIGAVQNVVVTPMSTIRAVTKTMFDQIAARQGGVNEVSEVAKYNDYGTMVKIAEGKNDKGDTIYLIRDVALGYGPKIKSQFIYSQKKILTEIIPEKAQEIVDMMFCGTKAQAQAIADSTGKVVYWSLRQPTDSMFAVVNKRLDGHAYNDYIDKAEKGINYMVVRPTGTQSSDFKDEVTEKYQILMDWTEMIGQNEFEKLRANDLLTNYDVAGAAGVNYSETFDANYSESWTHHFPILTEVDFFGPGISYASSALSLGATIVGSYLASMAEMKKWSQPTLTEFYDREGKLTNVAISGTLFQWKVTPVAIYSTVGAWSDAKAFNRTESFTIACDPMSRLNVDVYRVRPLYMYDSNGAAEASGMINPRFIASDSVGVTNIFTNYQFDKMSNLVTSFVSGSLQDDGVKGPRGFVFRTRGGATQNPWEDKRTTKFYSPGRELDARTLKIINPRIRLDKQSVSGVSIDDAAKFTVYVSNESEKPEATEGLTVLQLFSVDQANPFGAKISINGQPLTTGGMNITVVPGMETALQMEVRAGQGFDYDGLTIGVMSPTDPVNTYTLTSFNVHFLREAGGVAIAVPGDKWVLNTNAQVDSKRGWYLPVTINGFDRHQHNFDHIEFQYKESQRGDDAWTNICSFYADSTLMANANGVRQLMKPNANITTEFYGEGWVTERNYDLRAVVFCRNGSDFLTTPSRVISGIKDTRRPQLFGTPEPKSGLLTGGDNIIFNFSEDIENNYLSAITNFEVKGEVNNGNLSEMVSVQFNGTTASVESEAKRNFSGKDLTIDLMVKPTETGRDMPLFSHGTNGQKLQLWVTSDFRLKAVVNDQEFTSDEAIVKKGFTQVAVSINQTDSTLTFFNGGVQIGRNKLNALYYGTGPLIFGRTNELDRSDSNCKYYEGRMMEARLWYAAMTGGLIGTTYGNHRLTGFEKDLVDYYPMNEGSGKYVTDHTQGANARLIDASWAIPRGLSLRLEKADKGVQLTRDAMNSTAEQDYTLMFWFKTDAEGRGTLLSNGRGQKEDNGSENQFHIGFEGDTLRYRSNGFVTDVPGKWSDGDWHNFAMTVNRGRSVANIYVDKELRTTFGTDSLGGISGGYPLIGASRYDVVNEKDTLLRQDGLTPLNGNVDELMFFAQALPQQLISTYATKSPNGDEAGLMTYLGFDRIERQSDNDLELVPYAYSKKLYLDDKGEPRYQLDPETKKPTGTLVRDYVFVDTIDEVLQHFDQGQAAPVVPNEEVKNLKFGFIGRGNQLLVEIDEPAARLNHRNLYVTVRDIEDKNGNTMASPKTACYYVTNSSLQWMVNRLDATIKYGSGQSCTLPFYNNGAQNHTYTIENCPRWLTLNKYEDVIAPQALDYVTATASKDLNIGTYNEILYLTDEEGITEPFYLNLTVEGDTPDWAESVDRSLLLNSMNIIGQVYVYDEMDTDSRDIVGVFDDQNVCHGFANISHDVQTGENGLYLTVYDNQTSGRELNFRLWQYSTGREIVLTPQDSIKFAKDAMLGTEQPVRFDGGDAFVQKFNLQQGWNWVSFNLDSPQLSNVNKLLKGITWSEGDILTDMGSDITLTYKNKRWIATGSTQGMAVSPKTSYAIKVKKACTFPIGGTVVKEKADRTIMLKQGWNAVGYTPVTNLSVETALSDYYDYAQPGDVIKSHTEFAYFSKAGNAGRWRGSLQYMKPGEGYMMLRKGATRATFAYPFYDPNSNFREEWTTGTRNNASALQGRNTMCVSAIVEGFELQEGDRLVAYTDGEIVGKAPLPSPEGDTIDPVCYLTIGGNEAPSGGGAIRFVIERDGEIVASTGNVMTFQADDVVGTPDEPVAINFAGGPTGIGSVDGDYEPGKWYTTSGVQLPTKPKRPGVYLLNGNKVVIK